MHLAVFVKQALINLGCCLFICTMGFGNNESCSTSAYRFKSITVNDNLSHSHVNGMIQDTLGCIWIGTNNGLNRFDGYRFTLEVLEIILDNPPDIVVSDVMMPVMDGIPLCKSIKEHELIAHLPLILLTARLLPLEKHQNPPVKAPRLKFLLHQFENAKLPPNSNQH